MKRLAALLLAVCVLLAPAPAASAKAGMTGTIGIASRSDVRVGGFVNFTVHTSGVNGQWYPMVALECYQPYNVTADQMHPVLVALGTPKETFNLVPSPVSDANGTYLWDATQPAVCEADIDAYQWHAGQETIVVLNLIDFLVPSG